jgi:hypothetical protein
MRTIPIKLWDHKNNEAELFKKTDPVEPFKNLWLSGEN